MQVQTRWKASKQEAILYSHSRRKVGIDDVYQGANRWCLAQVASQVSMQSVPV